MPNLDKIQTLTPREVDERITLLRRIVDDVTATWEDRERVRRSLNHFRREVAGSGSHEVTDTIRRLEEEEESLAGNLVALEQEVNQLGGIIKDPARGLVDFFSEIDGHLAYLSWKPGDDRVRFWHEIDDDHARLRLLPAEILDREIPDREIPAGADRQVAERQGADSDSRLDALEKDDLLAERLNRQEEESDTVQSDTVQSDTAQSDTVDSGVSPATTDESFDSDDEAS